MNSLNQEDTFMTLAFELKTEREKQNVPLEHIAEETRISLRHLQSLEEGRFSDLPGGIYNRAFLKAYCEFVGLEYQDIVKKYETEISPNTEKPLKPQPIIQSRKPFWGSHPVFAWSLMLLISATGLFFSRKWVYSVFSPYFQSRPAVDSRHDAVPEPKKAPNYLADQQPVPIEAPTTASASSIAEPIVESAVKPPR